MMPRPFLRALTALALAAPSGALANDVPSPVVEAEHAFAAAVREQGVKRGFLAFAAPDGIMFEPGPVPARAALEASPDDGPADPPLHWWPLWAGLSLSGDLGFTTGGATINVRYFTVWRKQPDGRWKWIYDGGPRLKAPIAEGPDTPVRHLPPATASAGSAEAALAEIAPLEADLARVAETDARAAHLAYLAEDGLAAGTPDGSGLGRAEQFAELARRPAAARLRPLGAVASSAGDMAFTYGEARWTRSEARRWGHYARIWQKRTEGWRLVADIWIAAPGEPPQDSLASN